MKLLRDAQDATATTISFLGTLLKYGGGIGLFLMAVVGTFAIDLVLLAWAEKRDNGFLTGFILGLIWSRDSNPLPLLLISPITSAIAVGLSFALGVSGVGIGILIGWGVAAAALFLGFGLEKLAEKIRPSAKAYSFFGNTGETPSSPPDSSTLPSHSQLSYPDPVQMSYIVPPTFYPTPYSI